MYIIKRALKKYEERILPLQGNYEDHAIWNEVKSKQKIVLKHEMELRVFRDEVRDYYKSYYENSDEAHLIDHADDVCNLALKINTEIDEKLLILASYIHDMYNREQRSIHDELAYKYVMKAEDKFLNKLSKKEIKLVAYAVLEHRASFKGEFYSKLSEIISSADRGMPDLEFIVKRSMKFNQENADEVYKHMKNKYGTNGYAKYPDMYQKVFKDELSEFRRLVDELTKDKILEIWGKSFQ